MDVQHALLSKIVIHQQLRAAVEARISNECFTDPRYQRIFGFLLKHWREYSTSPGIEVASNAFPAMVWEDHEEPIDYFIDAVLRRRRHSILLEGLTKAANLIESTDPDAVDDLEEVIRQTLFQVRFETARMLDTDLTESGDLINERLDDREANPGHLRGISTGFTGIDYVTGGLQAEQFVVLIGTPKTYKSATLLAMALACHEQGKVPLFIGFEMSNVEQIDRLLSLISHVSLTKIMNGRTSAADRREITKALKRLEAMRAFILSTDITSALTVSGVQAKIMEYQPDVVFIDGVYMMQSELAKVEPGSAQALTSISRGLKRVAQAMRLPIVVTTQASLHRSKGGLSIASAMYSQSWGQDCDVLLGVERVDRSQTEQTGPTQIKFRVLESRSGPRKDALLEWDWTEGSVEELDPEAQAQLLNNPSVKPDDDDDTWDTDDQHP